VLWYFFMKRITRKSLLFVAQAKWLTQYRWGKVPNQILWQWVRGVQGTNSRLDTFYLITCWMTYGQRGLLDEYDELRNTTTSSHH
jgi:hypothetical protein